ncbi:MAG: murein L,D-transpeptidase [Verrucomicrobia bacterium]|nr:murein L,D-transpeptidase [Verrucomicrobiota bacterium]
MPQDWHSDEFVSLRGPLFYFLIATHGFLFARGESGAVAPDRPVESALETQVELHRRGFSCGSIDGVAGAQTAAALGAFQRGAGIRETGILDEATRARLILTAPALDSCLLTAADVAGLRPVPASWLEKSELPALGYASALERVAERFHAHPDLIRKLNPGIDWAALLLGARIVVPAAERVALGGIAARVVISLGAHQLEIVDDSSRVIGHFPVSIARMVEKRPTGELQVTVIIPDPNYTFDPDLFPESAEGKSLARKLVLPPGANNPVGLVWIGLNLPGYGIHGTPEPEKIGRTESHGCFRLANWDALTLASVVKVGMPVAVEP